MCFEVGGSYGTPPFPGNCQRCPHYTDAQGQDYGIAVHTLSYSIILYHTLSYSIILYHTPSYSIILHHTLSYSIIVVSHPCFTAGREPVARVTLCLASDNKYLCDWFCRSVGYHSTADSCRKLVIKYRRSLRWQKNGRVTRASDP